MIWPQTQGLEHPFLNRDKRIAIHLPNPLMYDQQPPCCRKSRYKFDWCPHRFRDGHQHL
jgi:hypothetical protein